MTINKKVFSLLGTLLFLALLCKPVGAIDEMSWSPRTPAGGGYISDPNFYFKMGTVVKYGSQSLLFTEYTVTSVVEEETSIFESYPTGFGYAKSDDEGRIFYFNLKGESIDGFGIVQIIDEEGHAQYFSPGTSVKTTTTTNTYSLP
jgi:hypothetical protein